MAGDPLVTPHAVIYRGELSASLRRVGGVLIRMASVPRVEIIRRTDGLAKGTVVGPLPVHGLRHIQTVQPQLMIPPRTDFEIRWDMSYSAHIEGAFQISFRQELVEIRVIDTPRPRTTSTWHSGHSVRL